MRKAGNVISECGVVNLVDKDPEERSGLFTRVGVQLRIDLDDESGGNSRKQTSLFL